MTAGGLGEPCIIFALARESQAFTRIFRPRRTLAEAPCRARWCANASQTVLVLETGVGAENVQRALTWLLGEAHRPQGVLAAGFAGGLDEKIRAGDVVFATEIADGEGRLYPASWPQAPAPSPTWQRGRILTSTKLIADPREKLHLGRKHGALAVDMESAILARECLVQGIPFGCMRAVSDDVHTPLSPRLLALLEGGKVAPLRVLGAILRCPGLALELWRLASATRRAGEALGRAIEEALRAPSASR